MISDGGDTSTLVNYENPKTSGLSKFSPKYNGHELGDNNNFALTMTNIGAGPTSIDDPKT